MFLQIFRRESGCANKIPSQMAQFYPKQKEIPDRRKSFCLIFSLNNYIPISFFCLYFLSKPINGLLKDVNTIAITMEINTCLNVNST